MEDLSEDGGMGSSTEPAGRPFHPAAWRGRQLLLAPSCEPGTRHPWRRQGGRTYGYRLVHMVRDRMIDGVVGPGQVLIVRGVDVVGSTVHRHRGEGRREGADKQRHEQQPDNVSKPPHAARLPHCCVARAG